MLPQETQRLRIRGVKTVSESLGTPAAFQVIDFGHEHNTENIVFRYSHIITKIIRSELPPLSMPEIKCSECGNLISLPSTAYQNVENADVDCVQCNARLIVTIQNGELKHLTKGEPTS
jgi:DNA-directed RNA polymerase subunit RPC12/RpoP